MSEICDICNKSDCVCICSICSKHQPPNQTPVRKTRRTKDKINWISCNSCELWVHAKCTGLTNKEYKKINDIEIKKAKGHPKLFFKCLICCIKTATLAGTVIPAFKNKPTTQNLSTQTDSINSEKAETTLTEHKYTENKSVQTSEKSNHQLLEPDHSFSENTSELNTNSIIDFNRKTTILNKETIDSNNQTEFCEEQPVTSTNLNHKPAVTEGNNKHKILIRLIDNIPNNLKPKNSSDIKTRINNTISQNIQINYTYNLPKGGIAIHFKTEEDIISFQQNLNSVYPGSRCSIPKNLQKKDKVVIKNINPNIPAEDLTNILEDLTKEKLYIKRFYSSFNFNPLPIISITCSQYLASKLLKEGIIILNTKYNCEKYSKPVIRCFNCQRFGHISKNCVHNFNCHLCGHNHNLNQSCSFNPFCVNCKKTGHSPTSRTCPSYMKLKSLISK